jgi:hypothetical protein
MPAKSPTMSSRLVLADWTAESCWGYAATPMTVIAAQVGIALDTVYADRRDTKACTNERAALLSSLACEGQGGGERGQQL